MVDGEYVMMLMESNRFSDLETELAGCSTDDLVQFWKDVAYLKERTRFILAGKGVRIR